MSIKATGLYIGSMLFVCAVSCSGCAGQCTVAANWGKAYESAKEAQVERPDSGTCIRTVSGLDGKAAEKAVQGYREDFAKGASPRNYNINLGEISGVGKK